jgi:hypothetical protein
MLRALSYDTHQDWEALLPQALFAIRTAISKSIGLAPYQLLFGRDASQPINMAFGKPPMPPQCDLDYHRYAEQLRSRIDNAQTYAREKIALAITRQRRNYNQDAKEINVVEKVWLFTPVTKPGQSRKLAKFWSGPWIVTHKVNDICYNIVTAPKMESTALPQTVPMDSLCLYRMPAAPEVLLPQTEIRAAAQAKDDDDDYFMEYIPMDPHQQPQLLPHQPPPPGPPPGPPQPPGRRPPGPPPPPRSQQPQRKPSPPPNQPGSPPGGTFFRPHSPPPGDGDSQQKPNTESAGTTTGKAAESTRHMWIKNKINLRQGCKTT